ncbi:hypothetical protein Tco_0953029, partial [Tanacetum coccineum]
TPARANLYELGNRLPRLMEIDSLGLWKSSAIFSSATLSSKMLCKLVADKRFRKPLGQLLRGICAMQRKLSETINGWSSYFILFWAGLVDGLNVRSIEGNIGMEYMWESNVALWSSQQKKLHWKFDDVKTIDMENSFEYFYLSGDYVFFCFLVGFMFVSLCIGI